MNSKRSYLDSLNAGRQRRPSTALEQISRTLEELERRLDRTVEDHERKVPAEQSAHFTRTAAEPVWTERPADVSRAMSEPASRSEPSARESLHNLARQFETARRQEDQYMSVGRIADELKALREELRETVTADLHGEFEILRDEMRRMGAAIGSGPDSSELGVEFERLSDAIETLAGRGDERAIQILRLELEQMRSEMKALAREETLRSVGAHWDPAIDALSTRVEEIGEAISRLPESLALDSLEEKVRALATALDHLLGHADSHSSDLYRMIEERLDEISRAIAASFSVERSYSMDPEPFERIEARISSLARQIEELVEDRSAAGIADRLNHLSDRIDHIGERMELPEKAVEQLARQMMLIADRLDGLDGAPDAEPLLRQLEDGFSALAALVEQQRGAALDQEKALFRDLEKRIDAIAEKIGDRGSAEEAYPDLLAAIDVRFAELAARLDAKTQRADHEPFRMLEERLEDISRRLEDSALPGLDSELIRKLEAQVANLSAHLAEPGARLPEPDDLGPRLAEIERSIVDNRDAIFDAARKAAQEAVETLKGTPLGNTAELAEEVKALEKLARRADDRNTRTFEAIHDTLLKIVDRLSLLEAGGRTASDEEHRPAVKLSIEPAPSIEPDDEEELLHDLDAAQFDPLDAPEKDDPKRSPAEAAAAAAVAALNGDTQDRRASTKKRSMLSGLTRALSTRKESTAVPAAKQEPNLPVEEQQDSAEAEIDASILNEPLEPGSGAPDLNAIMRRVRDESSQRTRQVPPDAAKSDFIAAARRAAQAAAAEADAVKKKKQADARGTSSRFGLGQILRSRKSMALMAVAGIAIVAGGMQLNKALAPSDGETAQVAQEVENASTAESNATAATGLVAPAQAASLVAAAKLDEEAVEPAAEEDIVPEEAPASDTVTATEATISEAPAADIEMAAVPATDEVPAVTVPAPIEVPAEAGPAALRDAAAAGDPKAFFEIGSRYADGRGLEADMAKAAEWYEKAAAAGLAPAQYRIGNLYEKGTGVERDIEKAKTWYQLAAEQGNASAMHNLGVLFAMGADGTADNESAARWFQRAAELGVQDSQFNLGILYAKGIGVEKDLEESYKWFALVADKGDADAAAKRDEIAGFLQPEQLERAKGKAELWKAKPLNREANTVDMPADWNDGTTNTAAIDPRQAVASIQHILNENGYSAGPADGLIGEQTKSAIMAFQKDHGLDATGDVNEKLVRALFEKK